MALYEDEQPFTEIEPEANSGGPMQVMPEGTLQMKPTSRRKAPAKAKAVESPTKADKSIMVLRNVQNDTCKELISEGDIAEAKEFVLREPTVYQLIHGEFVVPTVTWS